MTNPFWRYEVVILATLADGNPYRMNQGRFWSRKAAEAMQKPMQEHIAQVSETTKVVVEPRLWIP